MSDQNDADNGGQDDETGFKPITSQEEFEKALGRRLERERSKFADYEDLKAKASRLDEIEDANKTELQKITERAEQAERRAAQAELSALKTRISAELKVPVEVLHGEDEATMRASGQKVLEWANQGRRPVPPVTSLKSGATSKDDRSEGRAAAALRAFRQG